MNVANLMVTKGLVVNRDKKIPQLIRVTATTADIDTKTIDLTWQNVDNEGNIHEPFATANLVYSDGTQWLSSWAPLTHLIQSRIEALDHMASQGQASRFTRKMAYTLFGSNLVDYADKYRGMQSVVMHELEAFADVQLTTRESGVWTVPPYFIDSVAHLAGFIMNCSDAIDTQNNYCVTPGWNSMRFANPLVSGASYRSYVKMIPSIEDPTVFFGDVYIMQDDVIIGMVGGIQFRRYPRILLNRFFSPPDKTAADEEAPKAAAPKGSAQLIAASRPARSEPTVGSPSHTEQFKRVPVPVPAAQQPLEPTPKVAAVPEPMVASDSTTTKALLLIATEAGLDVGDLEDYADFASLGVDSLMSLVISEKFSSKLGVKVGGSLFLDYPTIGDLKNWLDDYHN